MSYVCVMTSYVCMRMSYVMYAVRLTMHGYIALTIYSLGLMLLIQAKDASRSI